MGDTTISWTDKTWNVTRGCQRVSSGCTRCYAERQAARFSGEGGAYEGLIKLTANGPRWSGETKFVAEHLTDPLRWKKPHRIFVDSMSDLFYEGFTNEQIAAVFGVMAAAPQHTFQVLTKRAKRMREWFEWVGERGEHRAIRRCGDEAERAGAPVYVNRKKDGRSPWNDSRCAWPLPNVWLGVSVENQDAANERIPDLLATPAAIRFLSCEPLLGEVVLTRYLARMHRRMGSFGEEVVRLPEQIGWVIAGCESGPGARECSVEWLRSQRDQCAAAGVPFFLKQAVDVAVPNGRGGFHSAITFGDGTKAKGRARNASVLELPYLDGVQHAAFPEVNRG